MNVGYDYVDNDVNLRDYYHITRKYRDPAHGDCNINLKLNHKKLVVFHNLKNYDSYLIVEELGKFNLKITVISNGIEKYISFTVNNNLSFIDSFQFLRSSLESLVKNLNKDGFKYLSQEFDNNVLDLVKEKGFYHYEYISDFEKFKEELPGKEMFCSSLTDKNLVTKNINMFLMFGRYLK